MDSVIIFCAKYVFLVVVLGAAVAWLVAPKDQKFKFLVAVILAGASAYILAKIAGKVYYDPRPFVAEHLRPLVAHAADNGFPSDHALFTATLTAATYFFNKKIAVGMALLTVVVGIARGAALIHSPLDIAAGWILGIAGGVAGYYLASWYFDRKPKTNAGAQAEE